MKFFRLFVLLFLTALPLSAQEASISFVTQLALSRTAEKKYETKPPNYYSQWYVGGDHGVWGFAYGESATEIRSEYLSTVIGPYFGLTKFLEVGLAGGVEAFSKTRDGELGYYGRYVGTARLGTLNSEQFYFDTYYENGPTNVPWRMSNFQMALTRGDWIWIGATHQTGLGSGAMLKLDLGFLPMRITIAPVMTGKFGRNALLSGNLTFSR